MKNSEAKKQGFFAGIKTIMIEKQRQFDEYEVQMAKGKAYELHSNLEKWGIEAYVGIDGKYATVKITDSPIRRVRIRYVNVARAYASGGYMNDYFADFVIPDSRHLPLGLEVKARPVRRWGWLIGGAGRLIDIRWIGWLQNYVPVNDDETRKLIMSSINLFNGGERGRMYDLNLDYVTIQTHSDLNDPYCWIISPCNFDFSFEQANWRNYEDIARCLLVKSIPQ